MVKTYFLQGSFVWFDCITYPYALTFIFWFSFNAFDIPPQGTRRFCSKWRISLTLVTPHLTSEVYVTSQPPTCCLVILSVVQYFLVPTVLDTFRKYIINLVYHNIKAQTGAAESPREQLLKFSRKGDRDKCHVAQKVSTSDRNIFHRPCFAVAATVEDQAE